jgi:thiamine phosphate synthase YjbQ (UPF0047 family)
MTYNENFDLELLQKFRKEFEIEGSKPNQLEKLLNKFNVFDVLRNPTREIKHSNVLAWLLDPNESHNIGNKALKLFLEIIPTPSDVDLTSLSNGSSKINSAYVFREWENIDLSILIKSGSKRFLIIIENKIKTKDSHKQLKKYRNRVENKYKEDFKKIFIYLTPEGEEPKDKNELQDWNLLSYRQIVSGVLNKVTLVAKGDVKKFIVQYVDILGRIILEDSKVNKLSNEIYKKHKKAINLIIENKDDIQKEIESFVNEKIKKENFILEHSTKTYIRFTTETLSEKIKIQGNGEWHELIDKIVLFEFENKPNYLKLNLVIGPGEGGNQLLSFMKSYKKIFTSNTRDADVKKPKGWKRVFSMAILTKNSDYDIKYDTVEFKKKIEKKWPEILKRINEIDEVFNNNWPSEGGK